MTEAVYATPALHLALDGVGTNSLPCFSFQKHCSQSITTTKGHDVIIVIVQCGARSSCDNITTVTDDSGLTFNQHISYAGLCCDYYAPHIWEFYAVATTQLKLDNITVFADNCCEGFQVVAISGANTRAIFDPNPSIPATWSGNPYGDCIDTCSVSLQTFTIDFLIVTTAINDAGPCGQGYPNGVVQGFTNVTNKNNDFEVDYAITTTPQSNVVFTCSATDATAIVVDAISFYGAFGI